MSKVGSSQELGGLAPALAPWRGALGSFRGLALAEAGAQRLHQVDDVVLTLLGLLVVAVGVAHVMPIDTADYERAATDALGRPVRIGSARLSFLTGLQLKLSDVRIGDSVRRETRLADISVKHGGTGTLVFATVTSRIEGPHGLAVEEERRTVFREEVKAGNRNQAPRRDPAPTDVPWRRVVTPDPVVLFRYSALTFNSHRIHYDRAWAMDVEGYPGLVVHGPFTTTLLIDFARDGNPGRRITAYTTQARAPLFDTAPFELRGRPTAKGAELWAVTPDGTIAMSAEVELAPSRA